MSSALSLAKKLYLLQLSTTTVPLGEGRSMEMVLGCYLVKTSDGRHILIDTGIAAENHPLGAPRPTENSNVIELLAALHLEPADIDTVICTHFDVDHAGYHDSFPSAEFVVQRAHYEMARAGHPRSDRARAHWDHPALSYRRIDGDTELVAGVDLIETSGHTTGHQSVLVRLENTGPVLLAIDAVMMQRLFTPERKASPHDENEEQLRASTRKLLEIVERERVALVVFGHDGHQWQSLKRAPDFYD
jgi:N-acyl homoserine lactone hydrolase